MGRSLPKVRMKTVWSAISESAAIDPHHLAPRDAHPQADRRDEVDHRQIHGGDLPGASVMASNGAAGAPTDAEDHRPLPEAEQHHDRRRPRR